MNMLTKSDDVLNNGIFTGFPVMDSFMKTFFDRGFAPELFEGAGFGATSMDIEVRDKDVIAKLPCAGCCPDDFNVEIVGDFLTVNVKRCKKCDSGKKDKKHYIRRECSHAEFEESLRLPVAVNGSSATAKYEDGVLTLTIPRELEEKNSSHQIKVG